MKLSEPDRQHGDTLPLSVVIVTQNEADRVESCIESVLAACRRAVDGFEVILVDSASTDGTVDRASDYPVSILRIPPGLPVSAGAGRLIGEHAARGELILHVDGDMTLTETWLPAAVTYLRTHDDVGAVRGCLNERDREEVETLDVVGGLTLFDGAALRSIGGFDPYLQANEDLDVGYRLRSAGYRIVRLPAVSATHPVDETVAEPIRRWRAGYYVGPGQALRKWSSTPEVLVPLARIHNYEFGILAWVGLGVLSLYSLPLALGWVAASALACLVLVSRLGPHETVRFGLAKTLGTAGMVLGAVRGTPATDTYPLDEVEVVQTAPTIRSQAEITGR